MYRDNKLSAIISLSFSNVNKKMAEQKFNVLEMRMSELENRIFGNCDKEIEYPKVSYYLHVF